MKDLIQVVKLIKNEAVWENMARVCIKMRRTKLARLCMGKLKNAKALRSIEATRKNDDSALAAQFALHLGTIDLLTTGLYEEAKEIWSETHNHSHLSTYYQASGDWANALEGAAAKDRPSLPTTYFKFAKYLEESGDVTGAMAGYEKSNASK